MKRLALPVIAVFAGLALQTAKANIYWDINGATTGAGGATPSGSWEGNNWTSDSTGASATSAWIEDQFPRFAAGTDATGSYTVTANSDHTITGMLHQNASGTVTISGTGLFTIDATGGPQQGFFGGTGGTIVINSKLTGAGGVIGSSGQISLFGNNDYSGGTTPGGGLVNFNNNSSFGTGSMIISANGGALISTVTGLNIPNPFSVTVANGSGVNLSTTGTTFTTTYSGNWSLGAFSPPIGAGGGTGNTVVLSGVISGSGGFGRQASTTHGTVILSGANTYTGQTWLRSSVTSVSSLNSVSGGSASSSLGHPGTVSAGTILMGSNTFAGTLLYTGAGETTDRVIDLQGTTGGATIQNDGSGPLVFSSSFTASVAGAKTLTLTGANTGNNTIGGVVVDSSSGATSLTKAGAGKWILNGANSYSGNTTVSAGTLAQGASGVIPTGTGKGNLAVSSGATFDLNGFNATINGFGTSAGTIDNTGASPVTLTIGNNAGTGTHSGTIQNSGGALSVTKTGTGTITLSGNSTYTGKVAINGGQITINNNETALGAAPGSVVADQLSFNGGTIALGSGANITLSANRGITLNSGGGSLTGASKDLTIPGPMTGVGAFTKTGSANVTVSGNNDYSGGCVVTGGGFRANSDTACGTGTITLGPTTSIVTFRNFSPVVTTTLANPVTINGGGTSDIDVTCATGNTFTLNGNISGAGFLTRGRATGSQGTVALNGNNSAWSGGLYLIRGGLSIGHKNALGTGTLTVTNPAASIETHVLQASTPLTGANAIGTPINILNGAFNIGGANDLELAGTVTLSAASTITNSNTGLTIISGNIAGANSLTVYGSGTLKLTGTKSYSGATTVNGVLQVDGDITASGSVTVGAGGTLKGNGVVPATTVSTGGSVNPGASPGTLTVTNTLTFNAGATNVVEINDFSGVAGSNPGWDLINANALAINGATTFKFNSLNGTSSGAAANFINSQDYDLLIAHATNGFSAGDLLLVTLDSSDFVANNTLGAGGFFQLAAVTNLDNSVDIFIRYRRTAVSSAVSPASQSIVAGSTANLSVTATGSGTLTYQWYRGATALANGDLGGRVSGATSSALAIASTLTTDSDTAYHCTVTGINGSTSDSGNATLAVVIAPSITSPASASTAVVDAGTSQTFTVAVSDPNATTYQWKKGGVNVSNGAFDNHSTVTGSTTATLNLVNLRGADSGDYTCVVQNAAGSATSLAQTLAVNDPVITQQPITSTFECSSSNALTVTAIGSTNADGVLTYQWYSPDPSGTAITDATNSFLSFPVASFANAGSYSVVVSNVLGNSITSSVVVVTVADTVAPVVTVNGGAATVECHGSYVDAGATATDTCDANPNVTTAGLPNVNAVGNYLVTYTATDATGNTSTATRSVTVQDTTAPTLTLLGSSEITISCGAAYTDAGASASDLCAGDLTSQISVNLAGLNPANPTGGDYTITYNVQDPSGNAAPQVSRLVHVIDNIPPVITVTGSNTVQIECHSAYTDAGATANDACAGVITPTTSGTVDANTVGSYTLTYSATDGVNTSTATRVVTVVDTTAPVITLNGAAAVTNECHTAYSDPSASASDDCDANAAVTSSGTVDLNTVGVYTRTYTATDASGNTSTTTRQITVNDTVAPVITVTGGDQTVECHTSYTELGATATDACDANPNVSSSGSVDANTLGSYTITYTAQDATGNTSTATRIVTVTDSTAPVVTLVGGASVTAECHGSFTDPGASASDACDANPSVTPSGAIDLNTPGVYTLTYTASDATGNTSTVIRTVTVNDTAAPVVTVNVASPINVECHGTFTDPGASATDGCDGSLAANPTGTVDANTIGAYTLIYTATDAAGNTGTAALVVNVTDSTAPVITVTGGDQTIECHASYTDSGATAADTCEGDVSANVTASGNVDTNTAGVYTITYTAHDGTGNTSTATRSVTVQDTAPPVITLTGNDPDTACLGGTYADPGATATDTCDANPIISTNGLVDTATAGDYTLTYTATDAGGNTASITRVVTVAACTATITQQPQGTTVDANSPFTLSVTAGPQPITYQWKKDGVAITSATDSAYTVANAFRTNAGTYTVDVSAGSGTITSDPAVVNVTDPVFTVNPTSATVTMGIVTNYTFTAVAQGTPTLKYQWYSLVGTTFHKLASTSTTLNVKVALNANATYFCVVSNAGHAFTNTSAMATLTVYQAAKVSKPAAQTVVEGQSALFKVKGTSVSGPVSYQWGTGGGINNVFVPLAESAKYVGVTNASLTINDVQLSEATANSGLSFRCQVSNLSASNVLSGPGVLNVHPDTKAPVVNILQPTDKTYLTNISVVTVTGTALDKGAVTSVWLVNTNHDTIDTIVVTNIAYGVKANGLPNPGKAVWTNDVTLVDGTNTLVAYAMHESSTAPTTGASPKHTVYLLDPAPFTVAVTGPGSVVGSNAGKLGMPSASTTLYVNFSYKIAAVPQSGKHFLGWFDENDQPYPSSPANTNKVLNFTVGSTNGLSLKANFQ